MTRVKICIWHEQLLERDRELHYERPEREFQ